MMLVLIEELHWSYFLFLVFCQASAQAVFIMETMMEHVAKALKKSPEDVKKANLYQNGQVCLLQFIAILRLFLWS